MSQHVPLLDEPTRITWKSVVSRREQRGSFGLWWNQKDLIQEIGTIDALIQQWERIAKDMYGAPFAKQLERLYVLEKIFDVIPDDQRRFTDDILQCITNEVEAVLAPCPDDAIMKAFGKTMVNLQQNKLDTGHSLLSLAQAVKFHRQMPVDEAVITKMLKNLSDQLDLIKKEYHAYPVLHWFLNTLQETVHEDDPKRRFALFESPGWEMLANLSAEKHYMKWSTIGWLYQSLVDMNVHETRHVGPVKRVQLAMLEVSVIPQTSLEFARLRSVLAGQQAMIESMKNKIIAAASVAVLSGAKIAAYELHKALFPDAELDT